jgi:glyoxylase-like metal-dependent hydrolase (beta-lactamase superfamily II)
MMEPCDYYCFSLGDFKCASLCDGYVDYPLQNMYANAPREQVEAALRQRDLPVDFITTPYSYLYVDTGEQRVLVDMGAGGLLPNTGRLLQSMKAAGIKPWKIDTVLITHAHPDHVGGTLDDQGRLVYPNAQYYLWKEEWDFWFSALSETKTQERFVKVARKNLKPLEGRVTLIEQEGEILPGIWALLAPGHTPGHTVFSFHSEGEQLYYIGDTVLQPLHLEEPDWLPIYDILPEKAAVSKRHIFDLAAEQKALVLGQHFPPFPSLGHIHRRDKGWAWEPIKTG